jgi:hypothetical protein
MRIRAIRMKNIVYRYVIFIDLTPRPVPVGRLRGRLVSTVTLADTSAPPRSPPGVLCDVGTTRISGAADVSGVLLLATTSWLATPARVARRSSLLLVAEMRSLVSRAASRMSIIFFGEVKLGAPPPALPDAPPTSPYRS